MSYVTDPTHQVKYTTASTPIEIAQELALYVTAKKKAWQLPFVLARKLRIFGGKPEDYREAVEIFCKINMSINFLDFYTEFVSVWDCIKHEEHGEDTLGYSYQMALASPFSLPDGIEPPHEIYKIIFSMAYYLSLAAHPDPFLLPRAPIAKLIGAEQSKTVTRIVDWLVKHKLIECVDASWHFGKGKKGKAKKYRLAINLPLISRNAQ